MQWQLCPLRIEQEALNQSKSNHPYLFIQCWHLFDQILLSKSFKSRGSLFYLTTKIFNPLYLHSPDGRYKGYPYRTIQKGKLLNGYSDNFPVYVVLRLE